MPMTLIAEVQHIYTIHTRDFEFGQERTLRKYNIG